MTDTINNIMTRVMGLDVVSHYKQMMMEGLMSSFPLINPKELEGAIDWAITTNYENHPAKLNNNYIRKTMDGTLLDILEYIQRLEPIITSSGVLFKKHKEVDNPLSRVINGFLKQRKIFKKEMFKYPKGSAMFEKYNLLQLLEKLNANAVYGILGNCTSAVYNIYVAEAVTRQGQSYISASIIFFESFLADNVKFNSLNEVITFIHNVVSETPDRQLDDSVFLDRNIDRAECFYKLMTNADPLIWVPTEKEMSLIWDRLCALSQEDINRIYYKNNLYTFCELPVINDMIIDILETLEYPYIDPNEPPECIRDKLNSLVTIVKEYVYYHHQYLDKLDRVQYMQRDVDAITDTDSCIVSLDAWYRFVLEKVYNKNLKLSRRRFNLCEILEVDEWGDKPPRYMVEDAEPNLDYNFYTDEVVDIHRRMTPCELVPQDGLCFSIVNILSYMCSQFVTDYIGRYCDAANSSEGHTHYKMVMKNEMHLARVLLTDNIRNYASNLVRQESSQIPDNMDARLIVAGLPINKSTLPDQIKSRLKQILYEDILNSGPIDQVAIMKKMILVEKEIIDNIMAKKTDFYKPDNISSLRSYAKDPMSVNGLVASIIYNEVRDPDMPAINLDERNKIFKVKVNINRNNVGKIRDSYPEVYARLCKLLEHPVLSTKLTTIAFPMGSEVPDWILEFVDIPTIVNNNLKNFPLESIGLQRLNNDSVNYSNIISV